MDDAVLERPAWNALNGVQADCALRHGVDAVRFQRDIGPLAAVRVPDEAGLAALAALARPGEVLAFIERETVPVPPGMVRERESSAVQMIARAVPEPFDHPDIVALTNADVPEMKALVELTKPGPFAARAHSLGQFWGLRDRDGRLVAMSGERMRAAGFGEVSAVCVHPDAQGRGLGTLMTGKAMAALAGRGLRPFLHAYADNASAIATYRRCGFVLSRDMMISMARRLD